MAEENPEATSQSYPFEAISKVDEDGNEYWTRDLSRILGYMTNYRNFKPAIEKAKEAGQQSGQAVSDHYAKARTMILLRKRWSTFG